MVVGQFEKKDGLPRLPLGVKRSCGNKKDE
jgi:hypothetical protein